MQMIKWLFFASVGKMVIYFICMLQHFISRLKNIFRNISKRAALLV